ncbi:MAG: DEAD/DEAH box helicase [Firmicutes bacterium]|nr:DEAD/DEAH box helicase [Bacillota bacterium]
MNYDISKGQILSLASNPDVYMRGEKYFRDEKITSAAFHELGGGEQIVFQVEGNYRNYRTVLEFDSAGGLIGYRCDCESHHIWKGACKHVVAGLLCLLNGSVKELDLMGSQRAARGLADAIEKRVFYEIDSEFALSQGGAEEVYTLSPLLIVDGPENVRAEFSVGGSRMYIIKNIPKFLGQFKQSEQAEYGKTVIVHNPAFFTGDSRRMLEYLQGELEISEEFGRGGARSHHFYSSAPDDGRCHSLSRRNTDRFMGFLHDKTVTVRFSATKRTLDMPVKREMPPFSFALEQDGNGAVLRGEPRRYTTLTGEKFKYFFLDDRICAVGAGDGEILAAVQEAVNRTTGGRLLFSGDSYAKLLTVALPRLRKLNVISRITGSAPELSFAKFVPRLYFDAEGGDVSCKADFAYLRPFAEGKPLDAADGKPMDDGGSADGKPVDGAGGKPAENRPEAAGSGPDESSPAADAAQEPPAVRDLAGEYRVLRRLQTLGFVKTPGDKFTLSGDELIYEFLHYGINGLYDQCEVYVTDRLRNKTAKASKFNMGVRIAGNLLELRMDSAGYTFADLADALESIKEKKRYFRLRDGRFLNLENDELQSAAAVLTALDVSRKDAAKETITLPKYRALYLDSLIRDSAAFDRDENFEKLAGDFRRIEGRDFPAPPSLERVLREYQKTGFKWLKTLAGYGFGGILADDMGLGKTLQVIALLLSEKERAAGEKDGGADRQYAKLALVVAPTSLLFNWESEIKRFAPELSTAVISGAPEKRREILAQDADVYITTYDMLKRDIGNYQGVKFAFTVADEAQNIKNHLTQNSLAVKAVEAGVRFALTGTPIENSLSELWSIFDFIMPGYLHSAGRFARLYETPIVKNGDQNQAQLLRKQIAPFLLRRVKSDVLKELPEKTETTLYAELYEEQKKIYLAHMLKARGELREILGGGFEKGRIRILSLLLQLRQICCHPALFVDNYDGGSGKLDMAVETVQMALDSGHRILLFSQFTSMLSIIKKELDKLGLRYLYLDGATPSKTRMDMASSFNRGENDLFLISLKAGGTGLNLTGADVVMHFDPWWNPAVMDQASDRAHRIGQKRAVQVFRFVAKDTIEEKIIELHDKKRNLVDNVLTQGEQFLSSMSEAEVRALFGER